MQKGVLIGQGRTAEVYNWGEDKILKLYFEGFSGDHAKREAEIGSTVYAAGIPSPAVHKVINEEGRIGIIFQRVEGKSMLKWIEQKPWKIFHYARQMARLQFEIHNLSTDQLSLPTQEFSTDSRKVAKILGYREKLMLSYSESLPKGSNICHGDFHPDNILITEQGEVVIDWTNAYSGHPLSDVARTYLMIRTPFMPPGSPKSLILLAKILKRLLGQAYLKEYLRLGRLDKEDVEYWIPLVASLRLCEKVPGEEKWLLKLIDRGLKKIDRDKHN